MSTRKRIVLAGAALVALALGLALIGRRHGRERSGPEAGPRARPARDGEAGERARALPAWFGQPGVAGRRLAGRVLGGPAEVVLESRFGGLARVETAGPFDLGVWPAAQYTVVARAPGRTGARLLVDSRDPSIDPSKLELALGPCVATLVGTVRDASGGVIVGARILVDRAAAAETGADGAYQLCVRPGRPDVQVSAEGYGDVAFETEVYGEVRRDVELVPEAVIVGRVVREDGTAAPQAEVEAAPVDWQAARGAARQVLTDDDGRFRLSGLGPGRYAVDAHDEAGVTAHPLEVAVATAETSDEITLTLGTASTLFGRVLAGGEPVAGVYVLCVMHHDNAGTARSQADGTFAIGGLRHGEARLSTHPFRLRSSESITIAGPIEEVTLEVEKMGSIAGRVVAGGRPVAGATVWARGARAGARAESAPDGTYRLEGLPAGALQVGADSKEVGAFAADREVTLAPAEDKQGIELDLDLAGEVSGVVVDQKGAPVVGVFVELSLIDGHDYGEAVTAADGRFTARQLSGGGAYAARVSEKDESPELLPTEGTHHPPIPVADGRTKVTGVRLAVRLDRRVIAGRVVNGRGQPIADARVRALPSREARGAFFPSWMDLPTATTDGEGAFTIRDLPEGTYDLQARSSAGGEAITRAISAGRRDLLVRVDEPGGVDVHLVDFPAGAEVLATRGSRDGRPLHALPGSGVHRVRGLVPDRYLVYARAADGRAASQVVDVRSGVIAEVTLRAAAGGRIAGRVTIFPQGEPVEGMRCHLAPRLGDDFGSPGVLDDAAVSDAAGRFEVPAPAGTLSMMCMHEDGPLHGRATAQIPASGVAVVEIHAIRMDNRTLEGFFGLFVDDGAVLRSVVPGSPAQTAGLRPGDRILSLDGGALEGDGQLAASYLSTRPAGTTVRFEIRRADGSGSITISVTSVGRELLEDDQDG